MKRKIALVFCFVLLLLLLLPEGSWAAPNFKLDGRFEDWQGRAFLTDGQSDGGQNDDFKTVFWGTSENEQKLFYMIERYHPPSQGSILTCRLYLDINGNGSYEDDIDRFAEIVYRPDREDIGEVSVKLFTISGSLLTSYKGRWGEGAGDGGRRFEFYVPMSDLNIYPGQPIRFYIIGMGLNPDRLPGGSSDIQWMPFPKVVKSTVLIGIAALFWLAVVIMLRLNRNWVFYYIWSAVGFTFLMILFMRGSLLEYFLEQQVGLILHHLLNYVDIKTFVYDKAPGTLLVLIEVENSWTTLEIDIESSGLLEVSIYLGLLFFYPPYSIKRKAAYAVLGLVCIYSINIVRLMGIIMAIDWGGRNMIFIAHTVLGRLIFFFLIIALYWNVFTKPSLKKARENVESA